jgi:hypothetical protein
MLDKVTSKEVIWAKKKSNFMHGLKSAILEKFQKSADWLDWPCPGSLNGFQVFSSLPILKFSFIFKI